jgi:hypothetical protein
MELVCLILIVPLNFLQRILAVTNVLDDAQGEFESSVLSCLQVQVFEQRKLCLSAAIDAMIATFESAAFLPVCLTILRSTHLKERGHDCVTRITIDPINAGP